MPASKAHVERNQAVAAKAHVAGAQAVVEGLGRQPHDTAGAQRKGFALRLADPDFVVGRGSHQQRAKAVQGRLQVKRKKA